MNTLKLKKSSLKTVQNKSFLTCLIVMVLTIVNTSTIQGSNGILEVASPTICETGSISFSRSGFFGECFDNRKVIESSPVLYWGLHRLEIRDISGMVVYSYSTNFSSTNNPIGFNNCSFVNYETTLNDDQMNGIVHGLAAGTYELYTWSNYGYFVRINGQPVFGRGKAGSLTEAAASVTISNDDLLPKIDVKSVLVDEREIDIYPVYFCKARVSIDFIIPQTTSIPQRQYKVTSSWAEVSSCDRILGSFSEPQESPLSVLSSDNPDEQILRLENILSSNALIENPFRIATFVGKKYRLKFMVEDGVCDPIEVEICVSSSGRTFSTFIELLSCFDQNFPDCISTDVPGTTTGPGPMLGYGTAYVTVRNLSGFTEDVIVQISDNMGNCLHSMKVVPTQILNGNEARIVLPFLPGVDLENLARDGFTNLVLHVTSLNDCSTCVRYDEIQGRIVQILCDFTDRLACTYDDPADIFYEEDSNGNVVFELLDWEGATVSSNFRLNPDILFQPIDDTHVALESETRHDFIVYPNPFSNELNYRGLPEGGILTLMDAMGRVIMEQQLDRESAQILSTDRLIPGVYFYSFIGKRHQLSGRLVKN